MRAPRRTIFSRPRLAASRGYRDRERTREIAAGERVRIALHLLHGACGQQLTAVFAGARAEIHQIVGRPQHVGIMLNHQDRVAEIAQVLENADQLRGIACMQANRRLVKNVERADKLRAKRSGELDALRLAAGERGGEPVERKVIEADGIQET